MSFSAVSLKWHETLSIEGCGADFPELVAVQYLWQV